MPQKKRRKLQVSDVVIILICLSVCLTSLWFFWKDLNSSSTRNDLTKIATIYFKRNVAQRKFADRVVWERLQQNSPLYNNDTIRTADGAIALIEFNEYTRIEITDNTMLQISLDKDGSVNVAVGGGNITVDTTASSSKSSVNLSMQDGSVVRLDAGSKLSAVSGEDISSSIIVQAGNAIVANAIGESQTLTGGESVSIEENGQLQKKKVTVTSVSKNLKVFKIDEKTEPVRLEWSTAEQNGQNTKVRVEISKDKDFTEILETYTAEGSSSIEIKPSEEKIYWRVFAEDEEDKAVAGRIQVVDIEDTLLNSPVNNSVFKYRKNYPAILFTWNDNDYADYYKLEISSTADFSQKIIQENVNQNSYVTSSLGKGNYYWRVTPYYSVNSLGFITPSETFGFVIEENEKITPPVLMAPANGAKITLGEADQNVIFAWKSDVKTAEYNVQISSSENFENTVYQWNTNQVSSIQNFSITSLPAGNYFWKVTRNSEDDNGEVSSAIGKFNIVKYIPGENRLVYPPDNYSVEKNSLSKLSFNWKIANEYKEVQKASVIQIAHNENFTQIEKEIETNEAQVSNLKLDKGDYYWRVAVKTADGLSGYSASRTFTVLDELGKTRFITPAASSKNVIGENSSVLISWAKVENADYYKCLVTNAEGKSVYKSDRLADNSVRVPLKTSADKTKYTSYKVSVTPYSDETDFISAREGESETITFEVRNPNPVKLISPLNETSFDGLTALRSPVKLSFQNGDTPVRTTVILQKQNANGTWKTVESFVNPGNTVELSRLTEGRYQWTVNASNAQGLPLDAKEYGTFVVKAVPLLAAANLITPEHNKKIDSSYLRKNRNITFNWNKVNGATDYEFVLYQVLSDGSYKNIYSQSMLKSTEVKIKNLSIFDLGTFEWRVTAYARAKDGYLEQKGSISSSRFTIDFALPKKVETIKPGTMYGE